MLEKFVKAEYLPFDSHNLSIKLKETMMHKVFVEANYNVKNKGHMTSLFSRNLRNQ